MLELELPLAEDGGGVQWHIAKLRALREQMHEEDLVCPMLWIPKGVCEDICPNKLLDLLNFAPNDWDSITCALVIISRGVLLGEKSYADMQVALQECRAAMTWPKDSEPQCRLLVRYHAAMAHVVDATWIMAACLHFGLPVRTVLDSMRLTHRFVPRVSALRVQDQAAVAAVRSLTLQIVHYTLWPSLMDERKPVFKEALESATCAMALAPEEGVWLTLYARCLPWTDTRKSILLQAGFNLHKTPFTVIEYASYLSHSGYAEAVDEAAKLCEMAIRLWPDSVFVNSNYVTLFLNSNCRAKLSLATADECLRRARNLAPDSPMLAGHRWNLRDVHRAGGQLSPILEEGEDVLADVGCWSPEKEQRLLAIAACLYPTALLQLQHLSRPVQAQQPGPAASVEQHPDEAAAKGPDTLWSPKIKKKFADPAGRSPPPSPSPDLSKPCPTALNVPPPDSEPDPSPFPSATAEHDPSEHTSTPHLPPLRLSLS
ncbi:uncharacterized protein LOC117652370 isoform X2 [Thrips palmi]|uniref:Uncharacterized protein LOC117652370 isoform X2 n=1 Tax=Thrips palmi TaxID=161013 RepID=A0A6P9A581_THRPL|nr:uncharacterized protein LOC117652370 isoform X2 [Thrips palmi]